MVDVNNCDLTAVHFAVYQPFDGPVMTSAIVFDADSNRMNEVAAIMGQLLPEAKSYFHMPEETKLTIADGVEYWNVHVSGKFAPIARVYILAVMNPKY